MNVQLHVQRFLRDVCEHTVVRAVVPSVALWCRHERGVRVTSSSRRAVCLEIIEARDSNVEEMCQLTAE